MNLKSILANLLLPSDKKAKTTMRQATILNLFAFLLPDTKLIRVCPEKKTIYIWTGEPFIHRFDLLNNTITALSFFQPTPGKSSFSAVKKAMRLYIAESFLKSEVEEMRDNSKVKEMWDNSKVEKMLDKSKIVTPTLAMMNKIPNKKEV